MLTEAGFVAACLQVPLGVGGSCHNRLGNHDVACSKLLKSSER